MFVLEVEYVRAIDCVRIVKQLNLRPIPITQLVVEPANLGKFPRRLGAVLDPKRPEIAYQANSLVTAFAFTNSRGWFRWL